VANLDPTLQDLFNDCERGIVHLEMRDSGPLDDPVLADWRAGKVIVPAERWPDWFEMTSKTTTRGISIRRARIVSEPVSDYVKYEFDVTDGLNVAAGEQVRWLPRRRASDLALPGNDFWLFDDRIVQFNHFSGNGDWLDVERVTDPAVVRLCSVAFESVWQRAIPHEDYRVRA
jgi:hypothetical protein